MKDFKEFNINIIKNTVCTSYQHLTNEYLLQSLAKQEIIVTCHTHIYLNAMYIQIINGQLTKRLQRHDALAKCYVYAQS